MFPPSIPAKNSGHTLPTPSSSKTNSETTPPPYSGQPKSLAATLPLPTATKPTTETTPAPLPPKSVGTSLPLPTVTKPTTEYSTSPASSIAKSNTESSASSNLSSKPASASLPGPTNAKPTATTAAPPPVGLGKSAGPSLPPPDHIFASSKPPKSMTPSVRNGLSLPTVGTGGTSQKVSLPPPSSAGTIATPKGPTSLPPPSSTGADAELKKTDSLPQKSPKASPAKKSPSFPPPSDNKLKKEKSKPKWSGERSNSITGSGGSQLNAAGNEESSTTSLLYHAPSGIKGPSGGSSVSAPTSTYNRGSGIPRPTLSVTGPSKQVPSVKGRSSKSASSKAGSTTLPSAGNKGAGAGASINGITAAPSAKPASVSKPVSAYSKPTTVTGEGGGGEFTIPLPDISSLPLSCQAIEDLWKSILDNLDDITSYWGIHLLSLLTIIGLNVYKCHK